MQQFKPFNGPSDTRDIRRLRTRAHDAALRMPHRLYLSTTGLSLISLWNLCSNVLGSAFFKAWYYSNTVTRRIHRVLVILAHSFT